MGGEVGEQLKKGREGKREPWQRGTGKKDKSYRSAH